MTSELVWNVQTLVIVLSFSIPLVVIVGGLWLKAMKFKSETELKQAMVQRGMSAAEIERVLAAGTTFSGFATSADEVAAARGAGTRNPGSAQA